MPRWPGRGFAAAAAAAAVTATKCLNGFRICKVPTTQHKTCTLTSAKEGVGGASGLSFCSPTGIGPFKFVTSNSGGTDPSAT